MAETFYSGRRLSYDGSLCTVRFHGSLTGTKGKWIGVEWDDPFRGKHNGTHQGQQIFSCRSRSDTAASFIRPTRRPDEERTVLEAIKYKYGNSLANDMDSNRDLVVISGKVAEEVGFEKIAEEQSQLSGLRIVLVDQLVVNGIAPRDSSPSTIAQAQRELSEACPNIVELDIGWNTLEQWQDIADIYSALPNLKVLKAGGIRLHSFDCRSIPSPPTLLRELHLEECLLDPDSIGRILSDKRMSLGLEELRLSGNELRCLSFSSARPVPSFQQLKSLVLDRNEFEDLDCMTEISQTFSCLKSLSLQANQISQIGQALASSKKRFMHLEALNLANNDVQTFTILNHLTDVFPNLSSLQLTENPLFQQNDVTATDDTRASEKSYYLALARIPTLRSLNYTKITERDRHEGELYYLTVAEREIRTLFLAEGSHGAFREEAVRTHPLYQSLVQKYDRESVIESLIMSANGPKGTDASGISLNTSEPVFPPGSLGARLVNATFYIPQQSKSVAESSKEGSRATLELPSSLPVKQVMSILLRHPNFRSYLRPLQFDLILESKEYDPVDTTAESSTRSAFYRKKLSADEKRDLWKEWGDWDADIVVERATEAQMSAGDSDTVSQQAQSTQDGTFIIRNGREWKRREVNIPHSLKRPWSDWLEKPRDVTIRIEPFNK